MRLPLLPQHSFALAEAEKTHKGAMASHGMILLCLCVFIDTPWCRAAVLNTNGIWL